MALQQVVWPFPGDGINSEMGANEIRPTELSVCTNMYYQSPYLLRARGGISTVYNGDGTNAVNVMYYWEKDSKLYHGDNAKHLYASGVLKATGAQNVVDMCSFGTVTPVLIVAENETANPSLHTWDGTTYATLTGTDVPKARRIMPWHNRLLGTNSADFPYRIFWSAGGSSTVWSGAYGEGGWLDIAPGEGGAFCDWIEHNGVVYIFRQRAIYRVMGAPPNLQWDKVQEADGVVAGTVADCGRGVLYATYYGAFPLGIPRGSDAYDLSRRIETVFQAFVASGASAAYSPELGAWILVNGTTIGRVSNVTNRPDVWTAFALPAAMKTVCCGGGLWFGSTVGKVYAYDHDALVDDVATTISKVFKTGNWNFGDELHRKNVRFVEGPINAGENATATLALYADGAGTATTTTTLTAAARQIGKINFNCIKAALGVTYTSPTGPPSFGGARLWVEPGDLTL